MKKIGLSVLVIVALLVSSLGFASDTGDCRGWYRDGKQALRGFMKAYHDHESAEEAGDELGMAKAEKEMAFHQDAYLTALNNYYANGCTELLNKAFPAPGGTISTDGIGL